MSEAMQAYLHEHALREPPLLRRLREETAGMPQSSLQIAPEQGQLLALLVELVGAQRSLEVGVFTGYSSLVVALAMPEKGHLVACEINETWMTIAKQYWIEAGVAHKIHPYLAPAKETLAALLDGGQGGSYDFAFVDADKEGYVEYYEQCLALLRPGGLVAFDNAFWNGDVANPTKTDSATEAIRAVTQRARADTRVMPSIVPIGDGMLLARKR